jgi:NADPH:quinone reductase-like Zn-dependent oxidoreductase
MPSAMVDTRRAVVLDQPGILEVMDVPMPIVRPIYAMVKTTAVAVHPVDVASIDYYGANGTIAGNDFAGIVEEVGSAVELDIKPGDRVLGFVHGCKV